jgi:hypothetical protein
LTGIGSAAGFDLREFYRRAVIIETAAGRTQSERMKSEAVGDLLQWTV